MEAAIRVLLVETHPELSGRVTRALGATYRQKIKSGERIGSESSRDL
jgi:hypothetical protein